MKHCGSRDIMDFPCRLTHNKSQINKMHQDLDPSTGDSYKRNNSILSLVRLLFASQSLVEEGG